MNAQIMALQASTIPNRHILSSDGESIVSNDYRELLQFVVSRGARFLTIWDLKDLVELLPESCQKQLRNGQEKVYLDDGEDSYKLFYVENRMLGITATWNNGKNNIRKEINLCDLAQYFPKELEPKTIGELQQKTDAVVEAFKELGFTDLSTLSSPVGVFENKLKAQGGRIDPSVYKAYGLTADFGIALDIGSQSEEILDYCSEIMTNEWYELIKVGNWEKGEIFSYDLTSAYPSVIANLKNTSGAKFFKAKYYRDYADVAILKGRITIRPEVKLSPIVYRDSEDKQSNPVGSWYGYLTSEELAFMGKYKLGTFKMEDGWFIKYQTTQKPFNSMMNKLYQSRQSENKVVSTIAKRIMVGLYGKFAERYEKKYGFFYNPIYAMLTTSRARLMVAKFIYENDMVNDVVSVLKDAVLTEKKVEVPTERAMGQWRMNPLAPALIMSKGTEWFDDKTVNGLTYSEIRQEIEDHPKSSIFLGIDKLRYPEIDRLFPVFPKNGKQLLENKYISNPRLQIIDSDLQEEKGVHKEEGKSKVTDQSLDTAFVGRENTGTRRQAGDHFQ